MNIGLIHKVGMIMDRKKMKAMLIYLYLLFLPLSDFLPVKINSILILLASAIWLFEMIASDQARSTWKGSAFWLLSALFLIQLLSILHGGFREDWMFNITLKLPFLLFPLIWNLFGPGLSFSLVKKTFVAGTLLACIYSFRFLWSYDGIDIHQLNFHQYETYLVLHRPYFGIYILLSFCFLLDHLLSSYAAMMITGLLIAFLIWIQAKTAIALLIIIFFVHIAFHTHALVRRISFIMGGAAVMAILLGSFFYYQHHRHELNTSTGFKRFFILSFNTRIVHMECASAIIQKHPWWGVGAGHSTRLMNQCYDNYKPFTPDFSASGKIYNAHNEWLEEGIRHGYIGILVYAGCFLLFFRKAFQKKDKIYLQFLLIVVAASMTESLFSRSQGVLLIALMNCLLYYRFSFSSGADNASTIREANS